jgi:flagellar biosynthesis/type III secretory pathway M-ring protein FliF/YscJ
MPTTVWGNYIWAVAPTILVGLLFWFAMRAIIRSDRTERKVSARIEAEERAKLALAKSKSDSL